MATPFKYDPMDHTIKVPNSIWDFFQKLTNRENPADTLRDVLRWGMESVQNGKIPQGMQQLLDLVPQQAATPPQRASEPPPKQNDEKDLWTAEFLALCEQLDVDPEIFAPDPRDDEPQYKHIKFKKRIILRGYRCQGMQNPIRTLSFIIRDIQDYTSWDELGPQGQGSFKALEQNYRQWSYDLFGAQQKD